jgi:hypothetical protein
MALYQLSVKLEDLQTGECMHTHHTFSPFCKKSLAPSNLNNQIHYQLEVFFGHGSFSQFLWFPLAR